jgi:putative endonuclease
VTRAETGRRGEAAAARYYLDRGCKLLAHNYRTRMGELDLVLQEGETIVICEVKTRSPGSWGTPAEAVDAAKRHRLVLAAQRFLQQTDHSDASVRFDVAEVTPAPDGGWQVHCIRGAFEVC